MNGFRHWTAVRAARLTVHRFQEAWSATPPQRRRTWLITLTIGWVLSGVLAFCLALLGQWLDAAGYLAFDRAILEQVVDLSPLVFSSSLYLGVIGDTLYLIVFVTGLASLAVWRGRPLIALSILATFFMTDVVVFVSWQTWNRARPEILYDGIAAPGLHSFPSGHTVQAIVVYGFLAYLWTRFTRHRAEQVLAVSTGIAIIILIAISRLELGVHWPSDVLGAVPVGLAWLTSLIVALRRADAEMEGETT